VRLRGGRSLEARSAATQTIFAAIEGYCAEVMSTFSLMLSKERRDIDPELSPKSSAMRDHLPQEFRRPTLPPILPSWTAILRGFAKAAS
jgi:5-carboxymethyl-2-hydroxymuconate isomerase